MPKVLDAAEELVAGEFMLIDLDTEEHLLRSWIKHDGLYRIQNMAVSIANARNNLASRVLRGVVVHELLKLRSAEPNLDSWNRDTVIKMLEQHPINPSDTEWSSPWDSPSVSPKGRGKVSPTVSPSDTGEPSPRASTSPTPLLPTPSPSSQLQDDDGPEFIDNPTKAQPAHPSSAAKTVVRQTLGSAGYPRTTIDRLAVQVQKLARENHPDALIREALVAWDQRQDCDRPEYLPTVLGDLVKKSRANPNIPNGKPVNKLRAIAELAQQERAKENSMKELA
ncbi:hypothetical protein HBE99_04395 [Mycobacteroides chelonae]|uniref:hypothetical protein n=1 Tax=Mycobacteroides chelonae TaxID=1774 RepID=UPI0019111EF2|nr:hypothetical protein [Mycobacteroides chelonae]QQG96188.1 hypothetical protein HBE99_04395 [Mycobacteroides chelonae]